MEADQPSSNMGSPSHDTALCIIPPSHTWPSINALRCFNDKAYGKWPPHINLVYPFVQPALLEEASRILSQVDFSGYQDLTVSLQEAGVFVHDKHNTVYLKPQGSEISSLAQTFRKALGWSTDNSQPHLTVAQSEDSLSDAHLFTLEKTRLITPLEWQTSQLAIMVRDQTQGLDGVRRMRPWKCIDMQTGSLLDFTLPQDDIIATEKSEGAKAYPRNSFQYTPETKSWAPFTVSDTSEEVSLDRLIVASYNVLAEFTWPPDTSRNRNLISNILSQRAAADILALQEVSDSFLPDLLSNPEVCSRYSYSTHAPAPIAGPLPSLLNVVVLSKFPVEWEYLPLQKKHKGANVARFPTVKFNGHPLVVAGCHLTQGFVDGAITAKKIELLRLRRYLAETYPQSPQLLVGDFNLSTSSYTLDLAVKRQVLTSNGKSCLNDINDILTGSEFQDVWLVTRVESGESSSSSTAREAVMDLYEGEQGATFDPLVNTTTAKLVGSGLNNRPQRYDRILFNDKLPLHPTGFNMFGQEPMEADDQGRQYYASDHWGIRCLFTQKSRPDASSVLSRTKDVQLHEAPSSLGGIEDLKRVLHTKGCLPNEQDETSRTAALKALEVAITRPVNDQDTGPVGLILVPVGSYGLGVWMSNSDIDCLCIGTISAKTFFTMALQRLRKASAQGITVLRKVKANSGTMLELDVQGIKFDLQYCAATSVVEGYPDIFNYPASHPAFSLPIQTLSKLKPARDMSYLRRSIPDMAKLRVAFLCIKAWAMARGLYGAKYGLLGGIHITVMLTPICKTLATYSKPVSTSDIVTTFFHHYSTFDWATQLVLDPFFHKDLKYHRTVREPMCLLGWHAPALNTALAASVPTVKTIAMEITRANSLLSAPTASWDTLLDAEAVTQGPKDFLTAYKSYVKVDARFWGASPSQGRRFLGWLESRCVAVLVDIDRKTNALLPRIWPARFTDKQAQDESEYHGFYLIGLSWHDASISRDDAKDAESALQTVLQNFESRMRSDERYYDASSSWLSASIVKASDLRDAVLDPNVYAGDYGDSGSDDDSDEEEEEEEIDEDDDDSESNLRSSAKREKKCLAARGPKPPGMGKFRSAADAMNRIRWDMGIDDSDYIIGFEDRFTGAMEKSLSLWKTEQTDEEFIPQHRILYFKKKSSGEIMWERRTRIDKLFNSGISTAR